MKIQMEAKQSERFLEDYIIITSYLWGIETATSSIRALTPKTLNFRKYKNRWRWRLSSRSESLKVQGPSCAQRLLLPSVSLPCTFCCHHTYFLHCLEGDIQIGICSSSKLLAYQCQAGSERILDHLTLQAM